VRLVSGDGASVDVRPVAYQFDLPPAVASGQDWDANWLMIQGDVRTADGRQWTFSDPCLTTWEARSLSSWLHAVATRNDAPEDQSIVFTEPNLAFGVTDHDGERVRIRSACPMRPCPPGCGAISTAGKRANTP
jgi:hypothetical protein